MNRRTRNALILLILPPIVLLMFYAVERHLLYQGVLNKRDLGFVGGESGSVFDYITNVWHWDAMGGFLILVTGILVLRGMWLLISGRKQQA